MMVHLARPALLALGVASAGVVCGAGICGAGVSARGVLAPVWSAAEVGATATRLGVPRPQAAANWASTNSPAARVVRYGFVIVCCSLASALLKIAGHLPAGG